MIETTRLLSGLLLLHCIPVSFYRREAFITTYRWATVTLRLQSKKLAGVIGSSGVCKIWQLPYEATTACV